MDGLVPRRRTPPRDPAAAGDGGRGERTRREIMAAARAEFAEKGFSGASMNDVAGRTRFSKPMIYYHFGSKEQLYAAVMEECYGGMRDVEQGLALDALAPAEAMRRLVEVTFDYHADHPDYVRLISVENIHRARHIAGSAALARRNEAVIGIVGSLLRRGEAEGVFRGGVDPVDLHLLISATCFYRVSNRHTWGVIFGADLQSPKHRAAQRRMIVEVVLAFLRPGGVTRDA